MTKLHLRRNKIDEGQTPRAVCASRSIGNGKMIGNQRSTYQNIKCVDMDAFLAAPVADRCAHCLDAGLIWINSIRSRKGLAPIANWAEYETKRAAR